MNAVQARPVIPVQSPPPWLVRTAIQHARGSASAPLHQGIVVQRAMSAFPSFDLVSSWNHLGFKNFEDIRSALGSKVKIREGRSIKLGSAGLALIEYIVDNPDDSGKGVFEYVSPKEEVLAEAEAVQKFLATKARYSEGSGLFYPTSEKQWAYNKPSYSPTTEDKIHSDWESLKFWKSPTDKPDSSDTTPVSVHTPGGTSMHKVTSYHFLSPGGTDHYTHTYASDVEPRSSFFSASGTPGTLTKLKKFMMGYKRTDEVSITEKILNAWASRRQGWTPDQNTAMGGVSAKEAAIASGYPTGDWQWLHLIAFTFGGTDNAQPNHVDNLVAGLAAANGHHLVLENLIKKLILSGTTDEVKIAATAHMNPGSYHVATKINYLLKWRGSDGLERYQDFEINVLDPNKSMGGHLSIVYSVSSQLKGI